ncbi:MAG: S1C family serine protease [Dongiaceae bacterium]
MWIKARAGGVLLAAGLALTSCGQQIQQAPQLPVITVADPQDARPIQFRKIVVRIKRGTEIGTACPSDGTYAWKTLYYRGGSLPVDERDFTRAFQDELEAANYRVVGDPDALFEDPSDWQAEYLVAGAIKSLQTRLCAPMAEWGNMAVNGAAHMEVEWQVYSRLDRRVVYNLATQGSSEVHPARDGGEVDVFIEAFAHATRNLLADRGFHELIAGAGLPRDTVPTGHTPFVPRTPFAQPIATNMEAVRNNVVVVYAGGGHGSGFVIDDEGHLLTNEHVVRTAERVRVRFESGEEVTAAVLATDVRRDVALLKIERGAAGGLPIRFDPPAVGDEVYAVGAPLDPSYSATVSKGIVSSLRTLDGEPWIQSDVNVQPGNSGGPLLDDRGNIVGITSRGAPTDAGTPSGVNFFVPITEALSRLGLSPKGASS